MLKITAGDQTQVLGIVCVPPLNQMRIVFSLPNRHLIRQHDVKCRSHPLHANEYDQASRMTHAAGGGCHKLSWPTEVARLIQRAQKQPAGPPPSVAHIGDRTAMVLGRGWRDVVVPVSDSAGASAAHPGAAPAGGGGGPYLLVLLSRELVVAPPITGPTSVAR